MNSRQRVRWHLCHLRKAEIKLRRQTEVFSRAFVRRGKGREGSSGDQVSILSGVCPELAHLERVAGSRNRHSRDAPRAGETRLWEREEGMTGDTWIPPPSSLECIASSRRALRVSFPPASPLYPLSLFTSFFVGIVARRFHPSMSLQRAIVYVRSVVSAGSTAGSFVENVATSLRSISGAIGVFNFTTPLRAVLTRLSCNRS